MLPEIQNRLDKIRAQQQPDQYKRACTRLVAVGWSQSVDRSRLIAVGFALIGFSNLFIAIWERRFPTIAQRCPTGYSRAV